VVAAVAADEADASAVLVREDSPSVDLLLVDPAVAVKRFADLRRGPSECMGAPSYLTALRIVAAR
jgi:hypothetical protein